MRRPRTTLIIVILALLPLLLATGRAFTQEEEPFPREPERELDVLGELNRWRIRIGLDPLARNADLDYLAMEQARYMAPRVPFTDLSEVDFHTDQYGYGVFGRARLFGWPGYDSPDRVLVSEIAAYYPTVSGAINFWQTSRVHAAAVSNAGFREAGVAVLRHRNWLLSFVVLGGRPGVLPVTYDPVRNVLFLSLDRSIWTDNYRPTRVQILDDRGERLHEPEWLVWSNRILLPRGANGFITVVVTDGIRQIRGTVDLYNARIFPSDPTPTPSNTPSPTMTATPILQTATPTPIIPTATPTPTPAGGSFDIQMVYNNNSFTLINRSGEPIDLEPLQIVSNTLGQSLSGAWLGAYYQGSINAMPHATCVQAWSFEMFVGPPPLPSGCAMRASGRSLLRAGERFWLAGYFDVLYRQQLMARCDANMGTCGFDLP